MVGKSRHAMALAYGRHSVDTLNLRDLMVPSHGQHLIMQGGIRTAHSGKRATTFKEYVDLFLAQASPFCQAITTVP